LLGLYFLIKKYKKKQKKNCAQLLKFLFKTQIAQFEGNQAAALKIGMLILLCLKNNYGAMYNKYNTLIYADAKKQHL
jgi:hypothetical protein